MSEAAKFIKIYDLKFSVSLQYQLIRVPLEWMVWVDQEANSYVVISHIWSLIHSSL